MSTNKASSPSPTTANEKFVFLGSPPRMVRVNPALIGLWSPVFFILALFAVVVILFGILSSKDGIDFMKHHRAASATVVSTTSSKDEDGHLYYDVTIHYYPNGDMVTASNSIEGRNFVHYQYTKGNKVVIQYLPGNIKKISFEQWDRASFQRRMSSHYFMLYFVAVLGLLTSLFLVPHYLLLRFGIVQWGVVTSTKALESGKYRVHYSFEAQGSAATSEGFGFAYRPPAVGIEVPILVLPLLHSPVADVLESYEIVNPAYVTRPRDIV